MKTLLCLLAGLFIFPALAHADKKNKKQNPAADAAKSTDNRPAMDYISYRTGGESFGSNMHGLATYVRNNNRSRSIQVTIDEFNTRGQKIDQMTRKLAPGGEMQLQWVSDTERTQLITYRTAGAEFLRR